MGICASSHITRRGGAMMVNWSTTAKVIHTDGRLQEFSQPIKASHVISLYPNTFLCNSETMYINAHVAHVSGDEELQLGQIYFLMPTSKLHTPLSLQELCALAVKASAALESYNTSPFSAKPQQEAGRCCRIPTGFEAVGLNFQVARGHLKSN